VICGVRDIIEDVQYKKLQCMMGRTGGMANARERRRLVPEMISALVGAVVGGVFALAGAWWQAEHYRRRRIKSLSSALAAEIASCVQIARLNDYASGFRSMAVSIRSNSTPGEVTWMHIPAHHNYFSVFEANAADIGELDSATAAEVVCFYQAARSWLDSVSEHNIPSGGALDRNEEASRHDLLAEQIDKLCEFGDRVVGALAGQETLDRIRTTAQILAPGPNPGTLPAKAQSARA
jgi:hypothetical protein